VCLMASPALPNGSVHWLAIPFIYNFELEARYSEVFSGFPQPFHAEMENALTIASFYEVGGR
jgi:hypothetical protein